MRMQLQDLRVLATGPGARDISPPARKLIRKQNAKDEFNAPITDAAQSTERREATYAVSLFDSGDLVRPRSLARLARHLERHGQHCQRAPDPFRNPPERRSCSRVSGVTTGGGPTATAELYDPSTGTWSSAASMNVARSRHVAVLLDNGRVLVAGGRTASGVHTASTEIYDPSSDTWAATAPMSVGRDNFTGTLLADDRVLVSGGVGGDGSGARVEKSAEIYDPALGQWTPAGNMSKRKFNHAAVRLDDGRVLVVVGASEAGDCIYSATAEIFSPATGDWQATDPMATPRGLPALALLPTGDVLVAGGLTLPATCVPATPSAELYDASSMRWGTTAAMATARRAFGDAQLNDGRVLVAGGRPLRRRAPFIRRALRSSFADGGRSWIDDDGSRRSAPHAARGRARPRDRRCARVRAAGQRRALYAAACCAVTRFCQTRRGLGPAIFSCSLSMLAPH
jgi:Kelch motif